MGAHVVHDRKIRSIVRPFLCIAFALGLLSASSVSAFILIQDINPDNSNILGLGSGGRINGLATVPGDNKVFYAASEWGGLFKTTDQGRTWFRLDRHLPVVTWDIEVDPSNANRVYGTSFYDGRVHSLAGINVSTNAGTTWTHPPTAIPPVNFCDVDPNKLRYVDAREEPSAFGISIDPGKPQHVYIGTNCGLAVSNDSGVTWRYVDPTPSDKATNVYDVVVHDNGIIDVCGDDGHLRSVDGGSTWTGGGGVPSGRCSIAVSPDESYVLFIAAADNFVYESDDAGVTWTKLGADRQRIQGRIPFVVTNRRSDDAQGNHRFDMWFGDVNLFRAACITPPVTAPGGATRCPFASSWSFRSIGHVDVGDLVFDSTATADACPIISSNDGGVYFNTRLGADCDDPRWQQPVISPHTLWLYGMVGTRQLSAPEDDLYLGTQDNGTWVTTNTGSIPKPDWLAGIFGDVFDIATDGDNVLYKTTSGGVGLASRAFARAGRSINPPGSRVGATFLFGEGIAAWGRNRFVILMQDCGAGHVLHPTCPGTVSERGIFITQDITATPVQWTELGATTKPPTDMAPDDQLLSIQVSLRAGKPTFYVLVGSGAADDARLPHRLWKFEGTDPAGKWQRVDTNIPGDGTVVDIGRIGIFAVAPSDPDRLYASHLGPNGPEMVFSNDGGRTWFNDAVLDARMTGGGIFKYQTGLGGGPTNFTPNFFGYPQPSLIAFDPQDPNIIVAGGRDSGVFLSMNGGVNWDLLTDPFDSGNSGISHLPRPWFAYFGEASVGEMNIYIGTQGRGVWRITVSFPRVTLNENQVAFTVEPSSQKTITGPLGSLSSLVGDADNFHGGDEADILSPFLGNQSQHVEGILDFFEVPANGFQGTVNLDTPADNQAVGFTHFLSPLPQSRITDATVTFTIKGTGGNVLNDTILFNDSVFDAHPPLGALQGFVPFIALQDLLTQNVIQNPHPDMTLLPNKVYDLRIDLSQVPVRFANTSSPGGSFSGGPDSFLDLRPLLANQGHFDMIFSDDTEVDGSILRATVAQPIEAGGCPTGSAGRFSFTATLTNLMPNTLDDIRIVVDQSTSPGVRLLLPTGELITPPGDVLLSELTPAHIDTLPVNASVKVPFKLCLSSLARFNFFVDVNALVRAQ